MNPFIKLALAASVAAAPLTALVAKDLGTHPDSPLQLTEIWGTMRPQFANLRISPDGKYFTSVAKIDDDRTILHIIDRQKMTVIDSETFTGDFSVQSANWFDNENLLLTPNYQSKLSEGRGGIGVFLRNIKTRNMRPLFEGTADNDAGGGSIIGKIDQDNYWMTIYPSGATYSEFPYNYLYKLDVRSGIATKVVKSPSRIAEFVFNQKNEVTHAVGAPPDSFDDVIVHKRVGNSWVLESEYRKKDGGCRPMRWHKIDPDKILYICDDQVPTGAAYWVDVKTGKKELIYSNPQVEIDRLETSDDDKPLYAQFQYDYPVVKWLDPSDYNVVLKKRIDATFPNKIVTVTSTTDDGIESVLNVSDEHGPGKYYLYNEFDGKIRFLLDPMPQLDRSKFPNTHAVRIKARDGMEVVGYLTVPKQAKEAKNLPLIIHPHGGPYGPRDVWGYNPEVAAMANAGYAVLQVNFRGSGGYGRKFTYDWYGRWGLEMQEDLEDATYWAIKSGVADANRICIYGASYGGYAALMGVVKTPDLYRCSIGYVGVYDLTTFMKYGDVSRSSAGRRYLAEALGTDQADRDRRSPTPNVDKIKVPIFLVEGMQDDRVFPKHYLDMKKALKAKGHRFETLEIWRAGHGARDPASVLEISCRMIDFFDRHIGPGQPTDKPDDCQFPGAKDLKYEYYAGK